MSRDISINNNGIIVPVKNMGKATKLIPWSMVEKTLVHPSIRHCRAPRYNVDVYLVEKTINGNRLKQAYKTEKDAMMALDVFLIRNGMEPRHILKRK
jgi:hypothetical protein